MKTLHTLSPELSDFVALLNEADQQGHGMLLVLGCDNNHWPIAQLNRSLAQVKTPVFGGVFPALALDNKQHEHGAIVLGLEELPTVARVTGMSDPNADYESQLLEQIDEWNNLSQEGTLMVLVDGLSSRISSLVENLFFVFGLENNFVGGGAGSLSFEQKPCIISSHGIESDVAIVLKIPRQSTVSVTHGWSSISEAVEVTEADRNVIKTLNWQPAFEAYKAIVDDHSETPITREAFFDTAKSYPLGLEKIDGEVVVRDPLMVQNDSELVCVGEVPQGAFVRILNGTPSSLLAAARQARHIINSGPRSDKGHLLLFDCISRALFLGPDIEQELSALSQDDFAFGAFTLGEIANSGTDYLEFLNKTTVLARLGEPQQ